MITPEALKEIATVLDGPDYRRSGRTWNQIAAASNQDAAFVCANHVQQSIIKKDYPHQTWLMTVADCLNPRTLMSVRKPVVFDHFALAYLLRLCAEHMEKQRDEIAELEAKMGGERDE